MLILAEPHTEPVRERWTRAAKLGLRVDSPAYPEGVTGADLALRREKLDDVFREERALLEPVTEQLAARGVVAIVADSDGVIVSAHGGGVFGDGAARVRLVEGACWREDVRGTNAIGTAIAERRALAVLGAAHYEERNKGLFCYATPVNDAYGGLVGVIDVTGPMNAHDPAVAVAVRTAGAALERALRAMAFARARSPLATIEKLVHRAAGASLLVEASGVCVANEAARVALDGMAGGLSSERIFGVPFDELRVLAAAGAGDMRFETTRRAYRVELDPIPGEGGRTLAVLVHLEPERTLASRSAAAPSRPAIDPAFDVILGDDAALDQARRSASRFAATNLPVLLLAETGTGKELFARAIHQASPRRAGPFVAVNCGALSPALLESELFGYGPGAFTGALKQGAEGRIAAADGGTLFLDEVAEMPPSLQAALLRVLDDGVYQRVGESRPRRANFRLVCATCRDLPAMVEAGTFRRDLFYRIHGATLTIPTLRERTDRAWLASAILSSIAPSLRLSNDAHAWIASHEWPGNVRELKSALAHAAALACDDGAIAREHFPKILVAARPPSAPPPASKTRAELFRDAAEAAVRDANGNLSLAARRLGVARSTLYRALSDSRDPSSSPDE